MRIAPPECTPIPVDSTTHNPGSRKGSVIAEEARQERVRVRTRELASIAGRDPWDVSQRDYEQSKQELMGKAAQDSQKPQGLRP